MRAMKRSTLKVLRRAYNAARRVSAGLRLVGENVSPECTNDLYVAHLSIYMFFSTFTAGHGVLDLGCGSGYGSAYLARNAKHVIGIDIDPRNIAYARAHFRDPALEFIVADVQSPPSDLNVDTVVSSNVFEHLHDSSAALQQVSRRLPRHGQFLLAVPPIFNEQMRATNNEIDFHHSNFFIWEWRALLEESFGSVEGFVHEAPPGVQLDFDSPFPAQTTPGAFVFRPIEPASQAQTWTLTAIYHCTNPLFA